ncbi:MAG: aldo/keto reductase [Rhodospirillaceae bacterium]|nr:aldo/keto reductase [Rhodospirillaceae bacterium]
MYTRREWLKLTAAAGTALAIHPRLLQAQDAPMITRAVPSTGEELPIIGLGSSATFSSVARSDDVTALRGVLTALLDNGGSVFDTAPSYGASEEVAGSIIDEIDARDRVFWATKLNVAGRGGGAADPDRAWEQVETSFDYIQKTPIDCIQVHNLGDPPTQLGILDQLKAEGRVRYTGITCTTQRRYDEFAQVMRDYSLDFIGVDYAVDNRLAAETILPLAQDRGIGVMVYAPFGRTRLWNRVSGIDVPEWAAEFGADSWAQFFLKYVAAHPAVTVITPATSRPVNMLDNLMGGRGALPDAATLQRMAEYVDALPSA